MDHLLCLNDWPAVPGPEQEPFPGNLDPGTLDADGIAQGVRVLVGLEPDERRIAAGFER